jgi:hypothetical protein
VRTLRSSASEYSSSRTSTRSATLSSRTVSLDQGTISSLTSPSASSFVSTCIYNYEDITIQQTIKIIKDTAKQTNLNRNIDLIITARNIPLFYLANANGLKQDAVRPVLEKAGIEIEQLFGDYPEIAVEFATLTARHNCQPVEKAQHFLAKLFDTANWKALLSHIYRQDFKHFFELVAKKHTQRVPLLKLLALNEDLSAKKFIEGVLRQGEDLEQPLLRTLEAFLNAAPAAFSFFPFLSPPPPPPPQILVNVLQCLR